MVNEGQKQSKPGKAACSWGVGQAEVLALRDEIVARLKTGETIRKIYLALASEQRVSVSQRQFYAHVSPLRDEIIKRSEASLNESLQPQTGITDTAPDLQVVASSGGDETPSSENTVNDEQDIAASAAVVPLARRSGAGGFTLNRDFNPEE